MVASTINVTQPSKAKRGHLFGSQVSIADLDLRGRPVRSFTVWRRVSGSWVGVCVGREG